jgi:radical SAM protein with 4Fe4S-binding SPASM domain
MPIPENFCSAPWNGIYVQPDGKVGPCCRYDFSLDSECYGNLNDNTLPEILSSENFKNVKRKFINGEKLNSCKTCLGEREIYGSSFKDTWNSWYKSEIDGYIENTTADGAYTASNINYWDIRPGNLCNQGCLMCSPHLSSTLHQLLVDIDVIPKSKNKFISLNEDSFEKTLQYISDTVEDNLSKNINDHFYFAGGEPLIMSEHARIIEMLDQRNFHHVTLRYNTNLSTLKYKNINWLDVWKKFDNRVVIEASVDGTGKALEFQRVGANWENIKTNLSLLFEHSDFISCNINFVVSILTFPTIIQSMIDFENIFGIDQAKRIVNFTPLTFPDTLALNSLDKKYIETEVIDDLDTMGYNTALLKNILNQTNVYTDDELAIIEDQRRSLFTRLKKYKNMDVRDILPWFEMPDI